MSLLLWIAGGVIYAAAAGFVGWLFWQAEELDFETALASLFWPATLVFVILTGFIESVDDYWGGEPEEP